MKMFNWLFGFCILLFSSLSQAGWQDIGNGGHALACAPLNGERMPGYEAIPVVYAFDYFEAMNRYRLSPVFSKTQDPLVLAKEILLRLPDSHTGLRERALRLAETFLSESHFGNKLAFVNDAGETVIPKRCQLLQMIVQKKPQVSGEAYYHIDLSLWVLMDPRQKATMIVHEVLYRLSEESRKRRSSEGIRKLVAYLISDAFTDKHSDIR